MKELLNLLDELYASLSPDIIKKLAEALEKARLSDEEALEVAKRLITVLDGLENALLRVNAPELGKLLADASLKFLKRYNDRRFRVYEAFVYLFLSNLAIDRLENLRKAYETVKLADPKDPLYAYILTRSGIQLVKRYEVHNRLEEAKRLSKEILELLREANLELVRGDSNILVFAARLIAIGFEDKELIREILENIGFISNDRLVAPSFVAAMFMKDLTNLAKALGLKFP